MLPVNFIVIGAAKCGTTNLCDQLSQHPDVFLSTPKEPRFFSETDRFFDETFKLNYVRLFDGAYDARAIGEGTTTYTHPKRAELAARRIREHVPDCRLIFVARHPIRRIESDWRMRCVEGWANSDINAAVDENPSLITHSLYSSNLQPYQRLFPADQLLVLFLEDFVRNPREQFSRVLEFLDVAPNFTPVEPSRKRNSSRALRKDTGLARWIRRMQLDVVSRRLLPNSVFNIGKSILTRGRRLEPNWDDTKLQSVCQTIRPDAERFLATHGKPSDFWVFP